MGRETVSAIAVFQMEHQNWWLGQGYGGGGHGKSSHDQMTGFGDVLDMECGREEGIKDDLKSEQLSLAVDKALTKTQKAM